MLTKYFKTKKSKYPKTENNDEPFVIHSKMKKRPKTRQELLASLGCKTHILQALKDSTKLPEGIIENIMVFVDSKNEKVRSKNKPPPVIRTKYTRSELIGFANNKCPLISELAGRLY